VAFGGPAGGGVDGDDVAGVAPHSRLNVEIVEQHELAERVGQHDQQRHAGTGQRTELLGLFEHCGALRSEELLGRQDSRPPGPRKMVLERGGLELAHLGQGAASVALD
jgi:hypothetical protein